MTWMEGQMNQCLPPPLSHPISTRKSATSLLRTEIVDVRRLTARRHTAQSGASESTSTQLPKRVNVIRGKRKAWLLSWPLAVCNLAVGPGRSGRCAAEQRSLELEVPVPAESESAESLSHIRVLRRHMWQLQPLSPLLICKVCALLATIGSSAHRGLGDPFCLRTIIDMAWEESVAASHVPLRIRCLVASQRQGCFQWPRPVIEGLQAEGDKELQSCRST